MGNDIKTCCRCERDLPETGEYFQKNENTTTGYQPYCRECNGMSFKRPHSIIREPKRTGKNVERVNAAIRKCIAQEIAEWNDLVEEHHRCELVEDAQYFSVVWSSGREAIDPESGGVDIGEID